MSKVNTKKKTTEKKTTEKKTTEKKTKKNLILNSSPGMATFIWGPLFWNLINDVAVLSDKHWKKWNKKQKDLTIQFWNVFKFILPCKWCRESYTRFIDQEPPFFPFVDWIFHLHNKVNTKLEKPLLEYERFKRKIEVFRSFSSSNMFWDIQYVLALNYDPLEKKIFYQQWFQCVSWLLPMLIQEKDYNQFSVECFLLKPPSLQSKFMLLKWLVQRDPLQESMKNIVKKYSNAIAHNTPEELSQLCIPLINKCINYDKNKKNKT